MITTKFYQDKRFTKDESNKVAPIKITISRKGTTAHISTGIKVLPSQWDAKKQCVIEHENSKRINLHLTKLKARIETIILEMEDAGKAQGMDATKVKKYITSILEPNEMKEQENTFISRYTKFSLSKKAQRTKEIYLTTLKRMQEYDSNISNLKFEDIDKTWLKGFDNFLSKTSSSANARNIHFRNIRACFNDAIDDEITSYYPFRKFKLKNEQTSKRALSIEQIKALFNCKPCGLYTEYIDIFKLIFLLCGINIVDLFNLTEKNIVNGRLEYIRAKTKKRYSILIEPEAMLLINKYKGKNKLLCLADRYANYNDYKSRLNRNLKKIGNITGDRYKHSNIQIMKPIEPKLSTYWARHTWATIASELDIPNETIAAGLGHNIGNPITSIYIDFNQKKVDEANRKIIDYIIYNKV